MVIGPPGTPYHLGFYNFEFEFPKTYPNTPPSCVIVTTDGGKLRFNPNLYAGGKVCLSILGTWRGESEDEWRSTYSISYVLFAIQSLIMTRQPYHNEPGYEDPAVKGRTPEEVLAYSDKITHENLRHAVCDQVERALAAPQLNIFSEQIKHHFLMWYDNYKEIALANRSKDGQQFAAMPFEFPGNNCTGNYNYGLVLQRLDVIKTRIDAETGTMKDQGKVATEKQSGWMYLKLWEEVQRLKSGGELDGISAGPISEANIFYWEASIFGPDGSLFEGGIFNLEIVYSSNSDIPPRIRFTTSMYHPHITSDGVPFYVPELGGRGDPILPVLTYLKRMLATDPNPSEVTWLNLEAARLWFSKNEADRAEYKARVKRCVRRSVDE